MDEHLNILSLATQGKLPDSIDNSSNISVAIVRELVEIGFLNAIDASTNDGDAYLDPRITLAGREYLAKLIKRKDENQMIAKKQKNKATDFVDNEIFKDTWAQIEIEYDISKRSFGRRMNFIKDEFKRKIIFRDTEQAFLLAHFGFNKPSVVLAGGVIEELLRLYLSHKGVVPNNNTLDSYLKACEQNGLLKTAIQRLADSVRQFRNLVHLERENSSRSSIAKATAKGALSSIFTVANDFT